MVVVENSSEREGHWNGHSLPQNCKEIAGTYAQQAASQLHLQDSHIAKWKWNKGDMLP